MSALVEVRPEGDYPDYPLSTILQTTLQTLLSAAGQWAPFEPLASEDVRIGCRET